MGWLRRMVTGKALTITLTGKRCLGDAGNDYVAQSAWTTGDGCASKFEWEFPSGAKLAFDCVLNVPGRQRHRREDRPAHRGRGAEQTAGTADFDRPADRRHQRHRRLE